MQNEIIEMLKKSGAIITNSHIIYTSGRHGSTYINKDALYPHTSLSSRVGELFAQKFRGLDIDVVAAPAIGGIILSQWTAHHLSKIKNKEILAVYTEKTPEKNQIFKRGYDALVKAKNILIIEDLTTTGGSVKKVVDTVKKSGGNVIAVCVMVNRDPENITSETIGALFDSLAVLKAESFSPEECPLCKTNIPINTTIGHGAVIARPQSGEAIPKNN
jgi:orotate phosphoribosyltransferase